MGELGSSSSDFSMPICIVDVEVGEGSWKKYVITVFNCHNPTRLYHNFNHSGTFTMVKIYGKNTSAQLDVWILLIFQKNFELI